MEAGNGAAPIFMFCSQGRPWYLPFVLERLRKSNPQAPVILFGPEERADLGFGITQMLWNSYAGTYAGFAKTYRHASVNSVAFERACFERWFIMNAYMEEHGISSAWQIDTDVLVFENLGNEAARLSEYDFSLSQLKSGHCSYWRSREWLKGFCDHILRSYAGPKILADFERRFAEASSAEKGAASISDMTLLHSYARASGARVCDTAAVSDASIYDHAFNLATNSPGCDRFEMLRGFKKLYWRDGLPCARRQQDGSFIRMKTVHCQGPAKKLIGPTARGSELTSATFFAATLADLSRRLAQRLRRSF